MELKLLGAAVAAALFAVSTASFGQGAGGGSGASGQDTARTQSSPAASGGTAVGGSSTTSGAATSGATTSTDCDSMTGSAKSRCERQHRSGSGASGSTAGSTSGSTSAPNVTKEPAQSGPGTSDRTGARGQPGVGTSSAGSN